MVVEAARVRGSVKCRARIVFLIKGYGQLQLGTGLGWGMRRGCLPPLRVMMESMFSH